MKVRCLLIIIFITISYQCISQDTVLLKCYAGNLKQIEITIGGRIFHFLFDTGGGETLISTEVAGFIGKHIYGNETGFRMSGEPINYRKCDSVDLIIGSTTIFHETVGVWDIMKVLPKDLPKLDGVLSLKSFRDKIIKLDIGKNKLIFETRASCKKALAHMTLLKSRFANGQNGNELTLFLGIPKVNHTYWFLFDSGNLDNVLLSHTTANEWGIERDTITQRTQPGELIIPIGNKQVRAEASSTNMIYDGSLNYHIISTSVFIIHFAAKQVWVN